MSARAPSLSDSASGSAPLAIALGCATLALRPLSYASVVATALVGVAGAAASVEASEGKDRRTWLAALGLGVAAVVAVRLLGGGIAPHYTRLGVASLVVAAVAEEAFFRRLVFGWAQRWGITTAVVFSAALFALIHVPVYGSGIIGLDFAAGLLLGWQRVATGGWTVPAITHVVANLLMLR